MNIRTVFFFFLILEYTLHIHCITCKKLWCTREREREREAWDKVVQRDHVRANHLWCGLDGSTASCVSLASKTKATLYPTVISCLFHFFLPSLLGQQPFFNTPFVMGPYVCRTFFSFSFFWRKDKQVYFGN